MNEQSALPRSPELMSRGDTALLVVDVQEKLLPAIAGGPRIVWNIRRLLDAAKILGLPVAATEQYPKGLGPTVAELAERLGALPSKLTLQRRRLPGGLRRSCAAAASATFWSAGIEAHVCVAADGAGPAGRRLAGVRGRRRRGLAVRSGLSDRFAADGFGRGDA